MKKIIILLILLLACSNVTYSQYVRVINISSWSQAGFGKRDTTNATADTLSRQIDLADTSNTMADKYTNWWQCWFASDDTIQISSSASFPANDSKILYPGETWTSEPNDVTYLTNYYYKILGTGTASVRKGAWGAERK